MRTRTKAAIAIFIVVAGVLAASFRIYAIIGGSGGYVLWNASEAHLFIEVSNLGYSANGLQYPWILFKKYVIGGFGVVESPTDQRAYLVVIRARSSGVERHIRVLADRLNGGPGSDPDRFTPLEGHIYASCPWLIGHFLQDGHLVGKDMDDGLCRWADDRFEKATEEDKRRLGGISRLTKVDFENDDSGWSRREFGAGPAERKFTIQVGDRFSAFSEQRGEGRWRWHYRDRSVAPREGL